MNWEHTNQGKFRNSFIPTKEINTDHKECNKYARLMMEDTDFA